MAANDLSLLAEAVRRLDLDTSKMKRLNTNFTSWAALQLQFTNVIDSVYLPAANNTMPDDNTSDPTRNIPKQLVGKALFIFNRNQRIPSAANGVLVIAKDQQCLFDPLTGVWRRFLSEIELGEIIMGGSTFQTINELDYLAKTKGDKKLYGLWNWAVGMNASPTSDLSLSYADLKLAKWAPYEWATEDYIKVSPKNNLYIDIPDVSKWQFVLYAELTSMFAELAPSLWAQRPNPATEQELTLWATTVIRGGTVRMILELPSMQTDKVAFAEASRSSGGYAFGYRIGTSNLFELKDTIVSRKINNSAYIQLAQRIGFTASYLATGQNTKDVEKPTGPAKLHSIEFDFELPKQITDIFASNARMSAVEAVQANHEQRIATLESKVTT